MAVLARRIWQTRAPAHVESPIIPIAWKGEYLVLSSLPLSLGRHVLDWRGCDRYVEWRAHIAEDRWHHGSVSPSWEDQAAVELQGCEKAMSSRAKAVAGALEDRREAYRKSGI
jgi:hypothetical protein